MGLGGPVPFICECADADCMEIVRFDIVEYENIRRHPRRFFAVLGHEAPALAAGCVFLIDAFDNHSLIEMIGRAGELAEHHYDDDLD
jgi:hypothetical protein